MPSMIDITRPPAVRISILLLGHIFPAYDAAFQGRNIGTINIIREGSVIDHILSIKISDKLDGIKRSLVKNWSRRSSPRLEWLLSGDPVICSL
jgi:hypothetical protein